MGPYRKDLTEYRDTKPWEHEKAARFDPVERRLSPSSRRLALWTPAGRSPCSWTWAARSSSAARTNGRASGKKHPVALVRAGATFAKGKLIERPEESSGIEKPSITASSS
ncbi:hypothetical protein AB0G05_11650 [Nonomuraea wenchangensis]